MAEYKDAIKRSHPYEDQAPEKCTVEKLPVMTGHDDQIETMSGQGSPSRYSTPFVVEQTPPPSRHESHSHPGDDVIDNPY
jgi:hypothetical protein